MLLSSVLILRLLSRPSASLLSASAGLFFLIAAGLGAAVAAPAGDRGGPATVAIPASAFIGEMPRGNTVIGAAAAGVPWVFNNAAMILRSTEDAIATVSIAEAGRYHLFVRSRGTAESGFRVAVQGRVSAGAFGSGAMSWQKGDSFDLPAGRVEVRLSPVAPMAIFDVLALSKQEDVSETDLVPLQFPPDVKLLQEFAIPSASSVKFGDVTGDGKMDFAVFTSAYSAIIFDHDGKQLWTWDAPPAGAMDRGSFEAPGSIWDFDGDGAAEVVHWRMIDGREWLVMAEGRTGAIRHQLEWPTKPLPHVYNNFRTSIAKFGPGRADTLLVFTDSGGIITISAYSAKMEPLWTHTEHKLKDHLGHYVYGIDLTGDGIDEVAVSAMLLNAQGKVLWNRFDLFADNHQHVDSYRFADLDGDGKLEMLASLSDEGTVIFRAESGEIMWRQPADHSQQVEVGAFLQGVRSPQVAVTARTYGRRGFQEASLSGQVYWFDSAGKLLSKWPKNPLNGNPDFVKGDWRGEGRIELFWSLFHLDETGAGTLYFADPVYHMFDFMGTGSEQAITLRGRSLKVYGYRDAAVRALKRDSEYLRKRVANHTHY